jgi:beta-xylosidase
MMDIPIFDPGYPIIDANVFFDTDGKAYLYYSRACYKHPVESEVADLARKKGWFKEVEESWVYGIQIKPDFSGVIGQPVLVLRPPLRLSDKQAEWESRSVTSREVARRWTEGSVTFKKEGIYYIMYSANHFGGEYYAIGYATASSPLGPYKKSDDNPVLEKNTDKGGVVTGTGHNSITYSPDGKEMFCVYHGRTAKTGDERVVFIDRMLVKGGKITVLGPTTTPQKLPSGIRTDDK